MLLNPWFYVAMLASAGVWALGVGLLVRSF